MFTKEQKEAFAKRALEESNSTENNTLQGGKGKPFWNVQAFAFIYAPTFEFAGFPHVERYIYAAEDCEGKKHTFESKSPSASLLPIWRELPCGTVRLTVRALGKNGEELPQIGMRTFFKLSPFPSDLPEKARPYEEAAAIALDYAVKQSFIGHWAEFGTPDPEYDLNVYPSKMISSVVIAMLAYADIKPEKKRYALKIAVNAADYLIKITFGEGTALEGLPPTYEIDFRENGAERDQTCATARLNTMMMLYPASAGIAYLKLYDETKDTKYLDAALKIGSFFRKNVCENGSWHLVLSCIDGKPATEAYCDPLKQIVPFIMGLYDHTGNPGWKKLAEGAVAYVENKMLPRYDWEGQFEDSVISENYSNLTHYGACGLAEYYARYHSDDREKMKLACELAKFAEDQFVVWKKAAPWNHPDYNSEEFYTPCALEQYAWYVPIDASTANLAETFLEMYKATGDKLWLAKATALADAITRVQRDDGMIPTHWMNSATVGGANFWMNCHFYSAEALARIGKFIRENGLE